MKDLDKAFENRIRLGIMAALMVNDHLDFNTLKALLEVTDGNLASHLKYLEKNNYITLEKEFVDRKPHTKYFKTHAGKKAFEDHLNAIEQLIAENRRS
nr:transcriptional regulator [Robertkochia sp. 3YJGBD-33]